MLNYVFYESLQAEISNTAGDGIVPDDMSYEVGIDNFLLLFVLAPFQFRT